MRYRSLLAAVITAVMISAAGCTGPGNIRISFLPESCSSQPAEDKTAEETATPTPTPEEVPEPTAVPAEATVTPLPTSTPAPRMIGTKTTTAPYIFMTNNYEFPLREIYIRVTGVDDWGKNLIPVESTIKTQENVQLFYDTEEKPSTTYDMKVVDRVGNAYAIYGIDFNDMNNATFRVQDEDWTAYLSYMSVSGNKEMTANYSETLARNYDADSNDGYNTNTAGSEAQSTDSGTGSTAASGDLNINGVDMSQYGYYDSTGDWISYYDDSASPEEYYEKYLNEG